MNKQVTKKQVQIVCNCEYCTYLKLKQARKKARQNTGQNLSDGIREHKIGNKYKMRLVDIEEIVTVIKIENDVAIFDDKTYMYLGDLQNAIEKGVCEPICLGESNDHSKVLPSNLYLITRQT